MKVVDLDVLVNPDEANFARLRKALTRLGFTQSDDETSWAKAENRHISLKSQQYFCDILTARSPDEFRSLAEDMATYDLEGIHVQIAGRHCLRTLLHRGIDDPASREQWLTDLRSLTADDKPESGP